MAIDVRLTVIFWSLPREMHEISAMEDRLLGLNPAGILFSLLTLAPNLDFLKLSSAIALGDMYALQYALSMTTTYHECSD